MTSVLDLDFVWIAKKCRDFLQPVEEFHGSECESGVKFNGEKGSRELVPIRD